MRGRGDRCLGGVSVLVPPALRVRPCGLDDGDGSVPASAALPIRPWAFGMPRQASP